MNEYDVKKALAKRGGQQNNASASQSVNGIPNSVLTDVFAGKRRATNEMMGHREELAPSIAAKMSQAFGMDFSAVKVYRSDAMAGTEMHGMAQGDKVVLSSDVDLNTQAGQATLGHELSHIRAQSMGMGSGRGLLNDASLEHQADSEGMLAARGMSIGGESMGMSMGLGMQGVEGLTPIGAGLGASAAAPMQANKDSYLENPNNSKVGKGFLKAGMGMKKGLAGLISIAGAPLRLAGAVASMGAAPLTMGSQIYDSTTIMSKKKGAGARIGNFFKGVGGFSIDALSTIANLPGAILGGLGNLSLVAAQKLYNAGEGHESKSINVAIDSKGSKASSGFDQFIKHLPTMGYHMAQRNFNDGSEKTLADRSLERIYSGSMSDGKGFTHIKPINFLRNTGNRKKKGGLLTPVNWLGKLLFGRNLIQNERVFGSNTGEAATRALHDGSSNNELLELIEN